MALVFQLFVVLFAGLVILMLFIGETLFVFSD